MDFVKSLINFLKSKLFGDIENGILVFTNASETLVIEIVDLAGAMIVGLSYDDNTDFFIIESQEDVDDIKERVNICLGE